jgi:hypothetical protein
MNASVHPDALARRARSAKSLPAGLAVAALSLWGIAAADPAEFSAAVSASHTDNIQRLPDGGDAETVASLRTAVLLSDQSPRFEGRASAAGTFVSYLDDTYDDMFVRGFNGTGSLHVLPGTLSWVAEDSYGPILEDVLGGATPDNRDYVNRFETGPELRLRISDAMQLQVNARYEKTTYELDSQTDSNQTKGDIALVRALSRESSWGLHVAARHVEYPELDGAEFDTRQAYVELTSAPRRGVVTLDLGASNLQQQGVSTTTPLIKAGLNWKLTPRVLFGLYVGSEYQESTDRFTRLQNRVGTDPDETQDLTALAAPLKEQYVDLTFTFTGRRTTLLVGTTYSKEEFRSADILAEQRSTQVLLEGRRRFGPQLEGFVSAVHTKREFGRLGREDKDLNARAGLDWRFASSLSLAVLYEHDKRDSNAAGAQYTVGTVTAELLYAPRRREER